MSSVTQSLKDKQEVDHPTLDEDKTKTKKPSFQGDSKITANYSKAKARWVLSQHWKRGGVGGNDGCVNFRLFNPGTLGLCWGITGISYLSADPTANLRTTFHILITWVDAMGDCGFVLSSGKNKISMKWSPLSWAYCWKLQCPFLTSSCPSLKSPCGNQCCKRQCCFS